MAVLRRSGWSDQLTTARLAWLSGAGPLLEPPRRLALALLPRVPAADGSDGPVPLDERTPFAFVVYGPPQHDALEGGHPHTWYSEPETPGGLVRFSIPGNPDVPAHEDYQCWAVVDADTGVVLYVGIKATMGALGKTLTLPVSLFRVTAEQPTA